MRIPPEALDCVKSEVLAIPMKKAVVRGKQISCVSELTFSFVMGKSLPRCMRKEAVGADAKAGNAILGTTMEKAGLISGSRQARSAPSQLQAPQALRQVALPKQIQAGQRLVPWKQMQAQRQVKPPKQTLRKPLEVDTMLGRITARWDCTIYPCFCYCDSGCHYCCTLDGVGTPGSQSWICFDELGCTPDYINCN